MDDQDKEDASNYVAQGGDKEVARSASILLRISPDSRAAGYRFPYDDADDNSPENKEGGDSTKEPSVQQQGGADQEACDRKLYKGMKLARLSSDAFVLSSGAWTHFWEDNIIKTKSDGISMWFLRDQTNKLSLFLSPARVTRRRGANRIQQ